MTHRAGAEADQGAPPEARHSSSGSKSVLLSFSAWVLCDPHTCCTPGSRQATPWRQATPHWPSHLKQKQCGCVWVDPPPPGHCLPANP